MRNRPPSLLPLCMLLVLAGCGQSRTPSSVNSASADDPVSQDIKQLEYGVRLAAANKRIDELERKIGALEATPEKLKLDLLTQRVLALEVKSFDRVPSAVEMPTPGDDRRSPSNAPLKAKDSVRDPSPATKQSSPKSEPRARLATSAEAKALASDKLR